MGERGSRIATSRALEEPVLAEIKKAGAAGVKSRTILRKLQLGGKRLELGETLRILRRKGLIKFVHQLDAWVFNTWEQSDG